jgi:hypothetical protein
MRTSAWGPNECLRHRVPDLPSLPSAGCIIAAVQDVAVCGMHAVDSSQVSSSGPGMRCRPGQQPSADLHFLLQQKGPQEEPDGAASPGNSVSTLGAEGQKSRAEADASGNAPCCNRQATDTQANARLMWHSSHPACCDRQRVHSCRSSHVRLLRQVADPCVAAHTWPCQ